MSGRRRRSVGIHRVGRQRQSRRTDPAPALHRGIANTAHPCDPSSTFATGPLEVLAGARRIPSPTSSTAPIPNRSSSAPSPTLEDAWTAAANTQRNCRDHHRNVNLRRRLGARNRHRNPRHRGGERAPWSGIIAAGDVLTIVDLHGNQAVTLFYGVDVAGTPRPSARYCAQATIAAQGTSSSRPAVC